MLTRVECRGGERIVIMPCETEPGTAMIVVQWHPVGATMRVRVGPAQARALARALTMIADGDRKEGEA